MQTKKRNCMHVKTSAVIVCACVKVQVSSSQFCPYHGEFYFTYLVFSKLNLSNAFNHTSLHCELGGTEMMTSSIVLFAHEIISTICYTALLGTIQSCQFNWLSNVAYVYLCNTFERKRISKYFELLITYFQYTICECFLPCMSVRDCLFSATNSEDHYFLNYAVAHSIKPYDLTAHCWMSACQLWLGRRLT